MSIQILDALSRVASRRFGSFADAATAVLGLLESALPGGSLALGQIDWDEGECRVIDARGTGVPRGSVIPLARGAPATGSAAGDLLDGESLAALGAANWVAAPLDAADGSVVGVLLATGAEGAAPPRQIAQLLLVGAGCSPTSGRASRPERTPEARRGGARPCEHGPRHRAAQSRDAARGHRARVGSKRGTVESYVVVCHLRDRETLTERHGEAMTNLLLKDVAEVLSGAIRRTDYLARVSPDALSAVLVGCKGPDGALAFLGRAERALERVTEGRPANLQLSYGIQRLANPLDERGTRTR